MPTLKDGVEQYGQKFVPYNGKIADITHADTNDHTLNLATALSETRKIIMVILNEVRIAGADFLFVYPNEGARSNRINYYYGLHDVVIKNGTQQLKYHLGNAGEDFDLYCFGYVVEA